MSTRKASTVVVMGVLGVALAISEQACTLGSDTIVNMREADATEGDGGAGGTTPKAGSGAACTSGKFAKPDLAKLKACKSHGHCYAKSKMPAVFAAQLIACDDAADVCVPDEVLQAGGGKLPSCKQPDSLKSVVGEEGGCITIALIPEMEKQGAAFLKKQECAEGQVCAPCKDPQSGGAPTPFCQPIGVLEEACTAGPGGGTAPGGGADPAAKPSGEPCCTTGGKSAGVCMSSGVLTADQKDQLPQDVCKGEDRCLPAAMVSGKATACKAGLILGAGVCMDKCFNTMMSIAGFLGVLSSDGCAATEVCVPCSIVKDQAPGQTVPGCQ